MPSWRNTAVRRAVPAKTSTQKRLLASLPAKRFCTGELSALAGECGRDGCHEWSRRLCGLWQPGSAQRWSPREHCPPGAASRHPDAILNGQQSLCPSGPSIDLPMSSLGTFGPRPLFLLLVLPFPLPFVGGLLGMADGVPMSSAFLLFGFAFGAGLAGAPCASGSRWKLTVGFESTVGSIFSSGSSPAASLFSDVMCSAMRRKAALSARRIWIREVLL